METKQILETIRMVEEENLDIRTITMGISLLDCIDASTEKTCQNIYNKITSKAKNLVKVGDEIASEFGIPIINKRISVTPIAIVASASGGQDCVAFARVLDKAAKAVGINFIGGYSALVEKGYQGADLSLIQSIPEALAETEFVCSSVNIGSTRAGINMDAVKLMGETIKQTAEASDMGCAKLVVFANAVEKVKGESFDVVAETVKKTAFKITRMGQLVGQIASERLHVPFGIVDLSLAPTPAVGDSVALILEEMGLEAVGTHGTTAALALLNDAVKKGGVMACNHVGGLSGAFIPVSEDAGMIKAVEEGYLNLEKLEAMTAICSVGLDMIAIPGDIPAETIAAMIADEAAIGVINHKTTAVRIIPAKDKKVGDSVEFGGLLGTAPVMRTNSAKSTDFIQRGGRIPAPIHSFKN